MLNLSCIVIGGGVARHRPALIGQIREKVNLYAVPPAVNVSQVEIVAARLEPEAGARGIYAMMRG